MRMKTKGLVIREQTVGEADRLITILSADYGVIRAFVRGARRIRSNAPAATQLLSYSEFTIYQGKSSNIVDEAQAKEVFFELRDDVTKLALAQYLAELGGALAPEGEEANELLRIVLNGMHFIAKEKRPQSLIKAVVELRLLSISGFMPDLVACESCGTFETEIMQIDLLTGTLYCQSCPGPEGAVKTSSSIVAAMRHICYSPMEKIFHFSMSDESLQALENLIEAYLQVHIPKTFPTLAFYHSIKD